MTVMSDVIDGQAIAEEIHMWAPDDQAITGVELAKLSDEELDRRIMHLRVFARTTPEQKLRIVRAFKRAGHVVAMTAEITVNYLKPVPLNKPLRVESREVKVKGRQHIHMAEILNQKGEVLARSRGLFIAIDPHKMFAKFVDR